MRNVLVTGASRGLGLAIAARLAASGYRVIAVARGEGDELPSIIAQTKASGHGTLNFRPFDLSDTDAIGRFIGTIRDEFGPLYGLVNNAALGTAGILATMPDREIERLVRVNVHSPILVTKCVIRSMMVGGSGRVVNISSVVGFTGYSGLSVYSASRAALLGFTRSLARELGPLGITVNSITPGFLATAMTKELTGAHLDQIRRRSALHRLAEVDDVAHAVDYLFSERARNITGTALTIDAGNTA